MSDATEDTPIDDPPADAAGGPPEPQPVTVGELEVPVTMSLGEVTTSIGVLQSMQAGYVFELGRPLGEAVELSVNGVGVGVGELVRVGDRIGVRVVKVKDHAARATGTGG
ncbi:MAG: FliM/FliN family flagellar motor switch protein [Planctomycetota bacterium]